MVNGIEVLSGSTVVQAINCGQLAGGTITINPSTFTNQGSLQASHGETLNVSGLTGNLNTASVSDSGSSLLISGTNWVNDQACSAPSGTTLSFGGTWTNPSSITADGATVTLNGVWTNSSTITATNSTLNLGDQSSSSSNVWSNTGTISATNSTVNLGGQFTLGDLGTFNRTGGTVNLTGTLYNIDAKWNATSTDNRWNPTSDFSTGNGNPNGIWTYGWMDNSFMTFTPYVNHDDSSWYGGVSDTAHCVAKHLRRLGQWSRAGQLSLHPGNGAQPSRPTMDRSYGRKRGGTRFGAVLAGR